MLKTLPGQLPLRRREVRGRHRLRAGHQQVQRTICTKSRNWNVIIKPAAFRQTSGEDALSEYWFGSKQGQHLSARPAASALSSVGT